MNTIAWAAAVSRIVDEGYVERYGTQYIVYKMGPGVWLYMPCTTKRAIFTAREIFSGVLLILEVPLKGWAPHVRN